MKIDFNINLKTLSGEELKAEEKPLTLRGVCSSALLFNFDGEELKGEEKVRRFKLAQRIYDTKEPISVNVEDVALIKELVAKIFSTLVTGQAWNLLDPN